MPCMGPGINEKQFEEAYDDIMSYLLIRHKIQMYDFNKNVDKRKEYNEKLKETLRDLFMLDACEGF